eukprot:3926553-Prymnesium_polylepis.1
MLMRFPLGSTALPQQGVARVHSGAVSAATSAEVWTAVHAQISDEVRQKIGVESARGAQDVAKPRPLPAPVVARWEGAARAA